MPDLSNRRDDTVDERVGKWVVRQCMVLPVVVIVLLAIVALIKFIHG